MGSFTRLESIEKINKIENEIIKIIKTSTVRRLLNLVNFWIKIVITINIVENNNAIPEMLKINCPNRSINNEDNNTDDVKIGIIFSK